MTQYIIKLGGALNQDKIKEGIVYVVKDGELKTMYHKGKFLYQSGIKTTFNKDEATRFDSIAEASKYHSLVGIGGRRGQIIKVEDTK